MNSPLAAGASAAPVTWTEPAREAAFGAWLQAQSSAHTLRPDSVRLASADASFRRYLRIDTTTGAIVGILRFEGVVQEIFDVALLPGTRWPTLAPKSELTAHSYVVRASDKGRA